jgi:hypothetical protein
MPETFLDILKSGASDWQDQVLDFLKTHNLAAKEKSFDVSYILWALKDKSFFEKVIQVFRDRFFFDELVWSYGFYHLDDLEICKEYIENAEPYKLSSAVGSTIKTKLYIKNIEDSEDF